MRRRRVLVLVHEGYEPPESFSGMSDAEIEEIRLEDDVVVALDDLGHEVVQLGLSDELGPLRRAIREHRPHVLFNLLEEFGGEPLYDSNVVGYLELKKAPYTGCNSRGMLLARDKALCKKILHYHRVRMPRFITVLRGRALRRPANLTFPLIVKTVIHEASLGIAQSSVVHDDEALAERVRFIHESIRSDALVEQYIKGRELYAAVLGNQRLQVFPTWELLLSGMPEESHHIATRKVKWDLAYQKKYNIDAGPARDLPPELEQRIAKTTKRICRRLGLDGYVRIDYRLSDDGELYFLEANPNPQIANGEEYASAAQAAGLSYEQLIQRIVSLGIRRARP